MEIAFKNQAGQVYLVVSYDEQNNWLHNRWIGFASEADIIRGAESFFKGPHQGQITQMLNDNREQIGPWDKVNDWLEQNWMPRAAEAGLQQFAHVISPTIFGALSAQDLARRHNLPLDMRIFGDFEKAQKWLKSFRLTLR